MTLKSVIGCSWQPGLTTVAAIVTIFCGKKSNFQKLGQVTLIDFATLSGKADQLSKIPIAEDIGIFIAHFEAIGAIHDLKEHEINRFIETFKKSYPGYERMSIEVEYYRFMSHLRLYELSQDPSGHTNIDKQLKKILVYSKKAISSSAA